MAVWSIFAGGALSDRGPFDSGGTDGDQNPYSSPVEDKAWQGGVYPVGGGSYVRQVKPLCICMIIQGVLEILMGILYIGMGVVLPMFIMNQQGAGGAPAMPAAQQQTFQTMFGAIYGVIGGVVAVAGIIRVTAGWRGLYFRNYGLGIASLFLGMVDIAACYCMPTSLGLCVWGCIVYFKPEVKQAFRLGAQGHKPAEIEANAWQGYGGG